MEANGGYEVLREIKRASQKEWCNHRRTEAVESDEWAKRSKAERDHYSGERHAGRKSQLVLRASTALNIDITSTFHRFDF